MRLRGSRPVVGSSSSNNRGAPDEARTEIETTTHPARVRAHEPVGGVAELELLEHTTHLSSSEWTEDACYSFDLAMQMAR